MDDIKQMISRIFTKLDEYLREGYTLVTYSIVIYALLEREGIRIKTSHPLSSFRLPN